ncbi:MAG: hypothetical protein JNK48_35040 [Bryobacterales bacterium]|nr:hypothetical protein [Bryobacterales bacterium]
MQSSENSHYLAKETAPGIVPQIGEGHRVALSGLRMSTVHVVPKRADKWGSRSIGGPIQALQRDSTFQFSTYHYANEAYPSVSRYGMLFEAAMGNDPLVFSGGTVESIPASNRIRFTSAHNLSKSMAVSHGGELRFVSMIVDTQTIELNAPFSFAPPAGTVLPTAYTYSLARTLKSFSIFDYWAPGSSVQRIGRGAVADKLKLEINGDYHTISVSGPMVDTVDSLSFEAGAGGLTGFPTAPAGLEMTHPMPVPGHLGQAHIGTSRFYTLTEAEIALSNGVDGKGREFGSVVPRCFVPGRRSVTCSASLYVTDELATRNLYEWAAGRDTVPVMLQLGEQQGQLLGAYMPNVIPSFPEFDDRENRLIWRIERSVAHGTADDELYIGMA